MNSKDLSSRCHLKRLWLAGLLLLLAVMAGCDSEKFLMPPADDKVMVMAAMGLNCQYGGTSSFQVNELSVRMRTGPGLEYPAYGLIHLGQSYTVSDVSEDLAWIAFEREDGRTAWVYAELTLPVCL